MANPSDHYSKFNAVAESRHTLRLNRRQLLATATGATLTLAGCSRPSAEKPLTTKSRTDIPLRITMVGSDEEAEVISRSWSSIHEQPLTITTIQANRAGGDPGTNVAQGQADRLIDRLIEQTHQSDLVIYPLWAVPELVAAEAIIPISDEQFKEMETQTGDLYSAVRNGAARYAGEFFAMPLGANQPALLSTDEVPVMESWEDYDRWVADDLKGNANEPLAAGWAATMFLWRAASTLSQGWLFTRDDFQPTLNTEPYVDVLQQMAKTAARYSPKRQTPTQIWTSIQNGQQRGGIGFAATNNASDVEVNVSNLPGADDNKRIFLDPYSTLVSLSATCRQSAVSKRWMDWIAGGEGSDAIRRQVSGATSIRTPHQSELSSEPVRQSGYAAWLTERLQTPVTLPSLQLFDADAYYAALDTAIGKTIDGKLDAQAALDQVAQQWEVITTRIGRQKQLSAWGRAQGLRA
ncbi:hypothetical protein Pla52o_07780 [Novipirellula galeiformis]|uniref:Bacterial extracellular solute-binding protein n=1 Tax=Novipirellula galeiformis TaxID=2528004 RepID=A0A5C6CR47_9BACT|nr:hypothetical protein Pla52o_07780 [Novipirellula galeiformis]